MGRRESLLLAAAVASSSALLVATVHAQPARKSCRSETPLMDAAALASPALREEKYGTDLASYPVDLHDAKASCPLHMRCTTNCHFMLLRYIHLQCLRRC